MIFFDFLQSDWLQERAAFYDILTVLHVEWKIICCAETIQFLIAAFKQFVSHAYTIIEFHYNHEPSNKK